MVSQRLDRLDPVTTCVLELAAVIGPEFDLRRCSAAGSARTSRRCWRRSTWPMRSGMIDRVPSGRCATASATSWCAGRCTTGCRALRRAELHLRAAEALEASGAAVRRAGGRPGPPLHRRRAAGTAPSGRSSTTCGRRPRPTRRWRSTRPSTPLRTALQLGVADGPPPGRDRARAGGGVLPRRPVRRRARRLPRGGRDRPRGSTTASCSPAPRSGSRTPAGGWAPSTMEALELLTEALVAARPARLLAARDGAERHCPGVRVRAATTCAAPSCRDEAIEMARRLGRPRRRWRR